MVRPGSRMWIHGDYGIRLPSPHIVQLAHVQVDPERTQVHVVELYWPCGNAQGLLHLVVVPLPKLLLQLPQFLSQFSHRRRLCWPCVKAPLGRINLKAKIRQQPICLSTQSPGSAPQLSILAFPKLPLKRIESVERVGDVRRLLLDR